MPIDGEELRLVRRAKRGDRGAFVTLIQPYYERVYATAVRVLGSQADAAEVTQEAILRTFWKIRTFHGRAHFYTWLYRTALNLCHRRLFDTHAKITRKAVFLDEVREDEAGAPRQVPLPDQRPLPSEELVRDEEARLVRKALAALRPRDFHILVLREFEDLSYEEIAHRLRLPAGTVMSRLHRARQALAKRLRALGLS